jgi:hypothetical protein
LRGRPLAATVAASLALIAAGCGDDPTTSTSVPVKSTTSTATSTSSTTRSTTSTTSTQSTTTAPPTTTASSTVTATETTAPNYDPAKPDSESNDKPPESGSPQESFEQACEQNPESCG